MIMRIPAVVLATLALALPIFAADIPRPAPPITFPLVNGGSIDLAKYKGKVVALEFLNTTCPHCQKCSQALQKMQQEYGPKGFQALGVAINEMAHMLVPDYIRNYSLTYPVGFAQREKAHEFLQHPTMLIMYVPQLVFIDKKGIIRAQYPGGDKFYQDEERNMRSQIESLLKETGPSAAPAPAKKTVHSAKKSS
ncbi:MAG: TlpA family protein disulfide reductase [Bryobacterales bacterium]|nr:TlpA family protein disulfide reductase [Bryobacterales bacterium]